MQQIPILITENLSEDGLNILKSDPRFKIDIQVGLSPHELKNKIANYNVLLVRSLTKVDEEVINSGQNLKLIGRAGVGIDNIDVKAAQKKNITVINTPTGNSISTAELAFGLLISLARKIPFANKSLKEGRWEKESFKGFELYGKTLGLIGFGNVSKFIAPRASAFGMKVIAYDPLLNENIFSDNSAHKVSLEDIFIKSDFISLHCTLNENTKHIINKSTIHLTKPGVCIINAARGELIESNSLLEALNNNHIAYAAIDVFEHEPPAIDNPLVNHPRILVTPHIGASTYEAQKKVSALLAWDVINFFKNTANKKT